jgi:hypothetical protein
MVGKTEKINLCARNLVFKLDFQSMVYFSGFLGCFLLACNGLTRKHSSYIYFIFYPLYFIYGLVQTFVFVQTNTEINKNIWESFSSYKINKNQNQKYKNIKINKNQ